jgi:hypothetical protein
MNIKELESLAGKLKSISTDASNLHLSVQFCEQLVSRGLIIPLLEVIQRISRDPKTMAPLPENDPEAIIMADTALMLLYDCFAITELILLEQGWKAVRAGDVAGSAIYKHAVSGHETEYPPTSSWQLRLLLYAQYF